MTKVYDLAGASTQTSTNFFVDGNFIQTLHSKLIRGSRSKHCVSTFTTVLGPSVLFSEKNDPEVHVTFENDGDGRMGR